MIPTTRAGALKVSVLPDDTRPELIVSGRADYSNITMITDALEEMATQCERCVSLDLAQVESIDTAAIEGLAGSADHFRGLSKRLHLKAASEPVRAILDRLFLSDLFCLQEDCQSNSGEATCCMTTKLWDLDVFSMPYSMANCQEARLRVSRVAEAVGFSRSCRADVMLAVGEAVANAIKHGKPEEGSGCFTVSCIATQEKLCVSVSDNGRGFSPSEIRAFGDVALMESGRGLQCINAVMDEVSFHIESGTTIRMVKLAF